MARLIDAAGTSRGAATGPGQSTPQLPIAPPRPQAVLLTGS